MSYLKRKKLGVFDVINYILLTVFAIIVFYPFYYMLIYSFNVGESAGAGIYLWPNDFTLDNYKTLLDSPSILTSYGITIARTVVGTFVTVFLTGLWAYGMADKKLLNRKFYTILSTIPMFFSGGIIPTYLLIKDLGLIDSFWVYIIPGAYSIWNMILMRTFFMGLPDGLEEAAKIDGANDFYIYFRIMLPLSLPMLATIILLTAVAQWNAWYDAFIYVNDQSLHPIQMFLKQTIQQNIGVKNLLNSLSAQGLDADALKQLESIQVTSESLKAAATMITIGPIIVVYPFLQKYFVKGLTLGSLKG
ncbi:MAG: carbohydrate ABC transporter permease [Candidatus Merdivicinus sp.]|jgi:putative aldouronate transport system permease protein